MPELPEVETIRRQLTDEVIGRVITEAVFDPDNGNSLKLRQKKDLETILPGKKIVKARRRGKHLFLSLDNDSHLMFHLKMTGRLLLRKASFRLDEHLRLTLKLDDGRELRFTDRERFADLFLWEKEDLITLDKKLGPEPNDLTIKQFNDSIDRSSQGTVKELLLDQSVLAGVGNINADEALWFAKIHPKRKPKELSEAEIEKLLKAVVAVLDKDLENGGTTIDSYLNLYGEPGKNQESFYVYGRTSQPCRECSTPIVQIELNGRRTHFCPSCQPEKQLTLFQ